MSTVKRLRPVTGLGIDWHSYTPYRKLKRNISNTKKKLIKDIMELVTPYMHESGYSRGPLFTNYPPEKKHLWIYTFENNKGEMKYLKPKLKNVESMANEYTGIAGFTDEGCVITDGGMGLVTNPMKYMCIEDLLVLHVWILNRKEFLTKPCIEG